MIDTIIRSFIAVEVDDAAVQMAIQRLQSKISTVNADIKFLSLENLHITLRFLGKIPISSTVQICDALQRVQFTQFHVELRGVGCFPRLDHIRVLWIGMKHGATELTDLYNETQKQLHRCGIAPDSRCFQPHITIGRVRSRKNMDRLAQVVTCLAQATIGMQTVTAIKLKKSELTPKGPVYTSICEIPAITENQRGRRLS